MKPTAYRIVPIDDLNLVITQALSSDEHKRYLESGEIDENAPVTAFEIPKNHSVHEIFIDVASDKVTVCVQRRK